VEEIDHTHIVGCGDIGRRVGRLCLDRGWTVSANVRSANNQRAAREVGIDCACADLEQDASTLFNKGGEQLNSVFYFAPPPANGLIDTRLTACLKALNTNVPKKVVLISTTGVYGDCQGNWVNETAPLLATTARALRRIDAETQLKTWATKHSVDYIILRVPGIYAKDRLPLQRIKSGEPIVRLNEAPWTNRIHADDLAQACLLAMSSTVRNEILNISDDHPSSMTDYFNAVADYAALDRPPQLPLDVALKSLSAGMQSYLQESRRIDNAKMKSVLGVQLKYPDLQSGLAA
jgi:nucleoside-diphosphate-sugar epimerase